MKVLTKFSYKETGGKWRFVLNRDLKIETNFSLGTHAFLDEKSIRRVETCGNVWKVLKGYAWDGCSPKLRIASRWIGTPDFEGTRLASLVHDSAYQFSRVKCNPLTRKDADQMFRDLILLSGSWLSAHTYFSAVRIFGGIHKALTSARKKDSCIFHV